jgi:GAF domain-containing protein
MNINGVDTADDPLKDAERLADVAELGLEGTDVDHVLEDLAREAAEELRLPTGVVSIVLDEAQWFVAMHGVEGWIAEARGTPVEWSFCRNVVRSSDEFVVSDAFEHPVMKESPLVQLEGLRCYAGIPLVTSRGHVIGSFCVQGSETHEFTDDDLVVLRGYADKAMVRIESRRAVPAS